MKSKSTRFAILAVSTLAVSYAHALSFDWVGAGNASWGTDTNWNPVAVPGAGDAVLIDRDIVAAINIFYAAAPELATIRQISSVTVNDTTAPIVSYSLVSGVAGSQLEFPTTSPLVSSSIVNTSSGAQRLTIQNPLFSQPDSTLSKGGSGNVRLDFALADGVTAFNTNVVEITSPDSGGDLWLSGPGGSTFNLPNVSFGGSNSRLSVTGAAPVDVNSGISVATGTAEIYVGGGGIMNFMAGSSLTGNGFTTSSNNSAYYYTGASSTINWAGDSGSFNRIRMGEQWGNSGTSTLNVTAGTLNITAAAGNSYAGNPNADGNNIQNMVLTVSGGTLAFTSATGADFNFGQATRNNAVVPANLTTVNGSLTVSGTGVLDLGAGTKLTLARRNATNTIVNTSADLNLDGGTLRTAKDIGRGTIGTGAGTTQARVFLNGGTLRATANISNLFSNFVGATDGIFVSAGNAVIDTQISNVGIAANLQENPSSTGGGLTKNGSGVLTLSGAFGTTGATVINGGSVRFNSAAGYTLAQTTSGAGGVGVQQGTVAVTSASFSPASLNIGVGANVLTPTMDWSGTGTISSMVINDQGALAKGIFNLNSGSLTVAGTTSPGYPYFTDTVTIGGKGEGDLIVNGGTLTMEANKRLIVGGLPRYGGTLLAGPFPQVGLLKITNGLVDLKGAADFWVGYAQENADAKFAGTGTVQLDGGVLQTSRTLKEFIHEGTYDPISAVVLNGGTLKAGADDNADWIAAGNIDSVTTNGASIIDTNGRSMGISAVIAGSGGLTKSGAGTLALGGLNTYAGETIVTEGVLGISTDDTLADGAAVRIAASGASLDLTFSGDDVVDSFYIGGVQQLSGKWGRTGSIIALGAAHESALITGDGLLNVTNGSTSGNFASWALANGVTGGPNGDSDNDGISNLVEYALNLNPAGSDGSAGTFVGNLLKFEKRGLAVTNGDVTYVIEESTDLGISDPWAPVTPTSNTTTEITYQLPDGPVKNFARFQTTVTP